MWNFSGMALQLSSVQSPSCLKQRYTYLPLVATNDCRFDTRDMETPHDVLVCIGTGRKLAEEDRQRFSAQHYFKTAEEMQVLFADIPEAITNTLVIARRCSVFAEKRKPILPAFDSSEGLSEEEEPGARLKTA